MEDLRALARVDARAFANLDGDDPYGYGALRQFFDLFPDLLMVAERDGSPLGYALRAAGSRGGRISEVDYFGESKPRVVMRRRG